MAEAITIGSEILRRLGEILLDAGLAEVTLTIPNPYYLCLEVPSGQKFYAWSRRFEKQANIPCSHCKKPMKLKMEGKFCNIYVCENKGCFIYGCWVGRKVD